MVIGGNAILQKWHCIGGLDDNVKLMLSELVATSLNNLYGDEITNWTQEQIENRTNFLRTAMTSAFQIGKNINKL